MTHHIDPVCGMTVSSDTQLRHTHAGETYLSCNSKCLAKFQAAPEKYLAPQPAQPAAVANAWTMPIKARIDILSMHPKMPGMPMHRGRRSTMIDFPLHNFTIPIRTSAFNS